MYATLSVIFTSLSVLSVWSSEVTFSTTGDWVPVFVETKGIDIKGTLWQYFFVKGCNDMFIQLRPETGDDGASVGLGVISNAKANMRLCGACSEYFSGESPYLNCDQSRPFWVSWIGGQLKVGQGHTVDEAVILHSGQNLLSFQPTRMGFSSGWSANGEWKIEGNPPDSQTFYRHASPFRSTTSRPTFKTITLPNNRACAAECGSVRGCKSFMYLSSNNVCTLQTDVPKPEDIQADGAHELWVAL